MAILWGIAFAAALHSWIIGLSPGLVRGSAFGLLGSDKKKDPEKLGMCVKISHGGYADDYSNE